MATMTVNCGSFDKYSYNGATAYGTLVNFDIPEGATVTGCSVSFTTHASGGNTADRAFSLNGARAHSGWASNGSLYAHLLRPGNNTFRATLKSTTPGGYTVCWWDISGITLYITYSESGGGSAPPVGGGGPVVISPSSIDAGAGSITVNCPAEAGIWHLIDWSFGTKSGQWSHYWETGGTGTINIPLSWIEEIPNAAQGTLNIRVRRSTTPAEPYSFASDQTTAVTIKVPADVVPTISAFTETLDANGVPGTISGYVQGKSRVSLAVSAAAGSYSSLASVRITGGGIDVYASSGTFGPFNYSGDIVFTATAVDTRGRSASRQVAISVMPYSAPAFSAPEAWRSNYDGVKNQKGAYVRLKSGASFSSLEGQNDVTIKGRVYLKGGEEPAWEDMALDTELILGGGALLYTRTYIAQIQVSDLLEARVTEFIIPTKKTGISIMAGMQGIAFGKSAEILGVTEFGWPIYNCPYEVGDILQTLNTSSPEDRWPGTEWESIAGRVLVGIDSTQTEFDTIGEEGGEKTHTLTEPEIPSHYHPLKYGGGVSPGSAPDVGAGTSTASETTGNAGGGQPHNNLQPYKVVYMWLRTA